jgi:hypothetical protein
MLLFDREVRLFLIVEIDTGEYKLQQRGRINK